MNIRVNYSETDYDEYTGFVRKWNPIWFSQEGNLHPGMQLECADLQRNLARAKLNDGAGYALELSGTRIGNVLDDVGWPAADRAIDSGKENVIATGALENVNSMEHLFKVQESELGTFFIGGNGYTVFKERGALKDLESQATFGSGNLPIFDPVFPLDDELLYNEIRLTREGGTEQEYSDAASILAYGLRTLARSGLLLASDVIVLIYCLYLLARYHDAKMRIKSFTVKPQTPGYEAQLWPLVLGLEIGQKITLVWTEADIDGDYFIEGIEHSYDYREGIWVTKYQCSDAEQYYYTPDATEDTVRPEGVGATTQNGASAGANWECVDEETANEDDDYVGNKATPANMKLDTYETEDLPFSTGTIHSVTIFTRTRCEKNSVAQAKTKIAVRVAGTDYYGPVVDLSTGYVTRSKEYTTSPATGLAWTWDEVKAMEIGVALQAGITSGFTDSFARCTQVYAVVNFTPGW